MPRNMSPAARAAIAAPQTPDGFVHLLTIDAPGLERPIYITDQLDPIMSRGNTFEPYPVMVEFPSDEAENIPVAKLTIDNIDLSLVEAIRSATGPIALTVELALASQPDIIEISETGFRLRNVQYNATQITGTLTGEDLLNLRIPADRFTPQEYPALFGKTTPS